MNSSFNDLNALILDFFTRKIAYIWLQINLQIAFLLASIYSFFYKKKRDFNKPIKKIAAVWYNPVDLTGSNLRMGRWKPWFEKEGYEWENFGVNTMDEVVNKFEKGSWTSKYLFYNRVLWRRMHHFFQLHHFDVVWVDRGFLPYYPLKKAHFERCIKQMGSILVVDSSDGSDYTGNATLVMDTMAQADKITVAYRPLLEFYQERFPKIEWFEWAVPTDNYIVKNDYNFKGLPNIGWMGSPANFEYLKEIEGELQKVASIRPFKLTIICRLEKELNIPGAEITYHRYGDDYYQILSSFDIGIAPFTKEDFSTKGKVGMKHQEFLMMATPQVCSPVGISEYAVHNEHALIVPSIDGWAPALLRLLDDAALREELGKKGRKMFGEHYTYESEFPKIKHALTVF